MIQRRTIAVYDVQSGGCSTPRRDVEVVPTVELGCTRGRYQTLRGATMPLVIVEEMLCAENAAYAGTGGVSEGNRAHGFAPGFLDTETGAVYRSRDADGRLVAIHRLDGLPGHLVEARTPEGRVARVKSSIVSGFLRAGRFYTRSEAAAWVGVTCA